MAHKQHEANIFLLSEVGHIEALTHFLEKHPSTASEGYTLIPLDREIEYILTEKGIPFLSGGTYRTVDADYMVLAETCTTDLFASDQWSFFTYRGVTIGHLYALQLQTYLARPLYYTDIISTIIARHHGLRRLIVFPTLNGRPPFGSAIVNKKIDSLIDTAECIGKQSNVEVVIPAVTIPFVQRYGTWVFIGKRALFGIGIAVLNSVVGLLRRPRRIRILASDYWRNLEPYLKHLPEAELVLIDRTEALNAGFRNIWDFRIRFLHTDAFSSGVRAERKTAQDIFAHSWASLKRTNGLPPCMFRGYSLQELLSGALDTIVAQAIVRNVEEIDNTHRMLERLKPDVVLVRSTVSTQTHFVTLAEVARARGIPSIEMQHGLEYYGPSSISKRHRTEFVGVYGPLTKAQLQEVGDTAVPEVIGSPRFDVYAQLNRGKQRPKRKSTDGMSILCIAPAIDTGFDADTYDIEEYYATIAEAVRNIPRVRIVIKFRSGPNWDSFVYKVLKSVFADIPYTIAQFEPLSDLYPDADIVVSCYSTAILEALQCGKPLIYLGLSPFYIMAGREHFPPYLKQNAMRVAFNSAELTQALRTLVSSTEERKRLSESAMAFLAKEYAFDGHASERAATFIRSLVNTKKQ